MSRELEIRNFALCRSYLIDKTSQFSPIEFLQEVISVEISIFNQMIGVLQEIPPTPLCLFIKAFNCLPNVLWH